MQRVVQAKACSFETFTPEERMLCTKNTGHAGRGQEVKK